MADTAKAQEFLMNQDSTKKQATSNDPLSEQWIDFRLIAGMRVVLGTSALLLILLEPLEPVISTLFCVTLVLYSLYGCVIYHLSVHRNPVVAHKIIPWLDLVWYLPLIIFASNSNNLFYYFFFFAIIVASFSWGLTHGLHVTLASAGLYTVVVLLIAPGLPPIEVNHPLLAPIGLLIFGYVIARWGGFHTQLKNRLKLLKDVTVFSNPRFGIDRTIKEILQSIRAFYDAEACLLVIPGKPADADSYQMYRVARGVHPSRSAPPEIGHEAAEQFLSPSLEFAVIYRKRSGSSQTRLFDIKSRVFSDSSSVESDKLAGMLEAQRYLSVPVYYRHQGVGRFYIVNGPMQLDTSDMDFVLQLMDHVTPMMENIRLIDNLASDAAEQERRRIAHDIHDSVIQPYLGLQFGLSALDQKLEAGNTLIRDNVQELLELTNHELAQLRRFVRGLRASDERTDVLLPAIERYAERFSVVTGIKVDVAAYGKVKVNDRLAAELFQIVAEGLSNVRRHAFCRDARVEISCKESSLLLQIKNSRPRTGGNPESERGDGQDGVKPFRPHSIAERAASLGGETQVFVDEKDYTVVSVGIPL